MSGFGDAMTAAIKRRAEAQGQQDPDAAAEVRRKAAAEAQRKLGYGSKPPAKPPAKTDGDG